VVRKMENKMEEINWLDKVNAIEEKYGKDLKRKIALKCIDFTAYQKSIDFSGHQKNSVLLVKIKKGNSEISMEYHQNDVNVVKDDNIFTYSFKVHYFRDLPSGSHLGIKTEDGYQLLDRYQETIAKSELENRLVMDIYLNYQFAVEFTKFLGELYRWNKGEK